MAQSRYYSATAQPTVLTAGITNATTVINVLAATGFPASTPFILALDYNTPSEEIVLVTIQAGTNLTVTRAYDGTSATSHNAGAGVRHTWTAMDGNDSRAHEAASTGVHGLAIGSAVVGVNDTQTLINKTLTTPAINGNIGGTSSFVNVNGHLGGLAAGSTGQMTVDVNGGIFSTGVNGNLSAFKTGDTPRTSTTTLAADPHLTVTAVANAVYKLSAMLYFTGDPAGDFQFQIAGPAGFNSAFSIITQNNAAASTVGTVVTDAQGTAGIGPTITAGTIAGAALTANVNGIITTAGTPGAIFVNWAQGTSNGTATTLKTNSHIFLTRIA
jgi:hypothetical protein